MTAVESPATQRATWQGLVTGKGLDASREAALRSMIGADRHRPGPDRWRLIEESVPIWALVGQVKAISGVADLFEPAMADRVFEAIDQVAHDYYVTVLAVRAAMHYYRERGCAIDTLLEANAAI
jgi:hypothetical protein